MFDLFNREALRAKSAELSGVERELANARSKIDELKAEVDTLTAKLRGDRVCDGYCTLCKNSVKGISFSSVFGEHLTWSCTLDCKCKDFEKKEC